MLKDKIQQALNDQIQAEFHSAYLYLAMEAWCEAHHFDGSAHWLRMQAQEELQHEPIVTTVDEDICSGCELCISVCPYEAREIKLKG